jgi:drug/metabolite transporter (DMT)-like permease
MGVGALSPIAFATATALTASVPLLAIAILKRQVPAKSSPLWKDLAYIAVMGTTLPFLLFFTGTSLTTGINAGLLQQTEPVYSLVLSYFLLREHIPVVQVFGSLMILGGALSVMSAGDAGVASGWHLGAGEILVLLTPLGYQAAHARTKRLLAENVDSFTIAGIRLAVGGFLLLLVCVPLILSGAISWEKPSLSPGIVFGFLGYAVIIVASEKVLWLEGIRRINLSKASGFLPMSVLASAVGAVLILGETLRVPHYVGATLILAGSFVLSTVPSRRR